MGGLVPSSLLLMNGTSEGALVLPLKVSLIPKLVRYLIQVVGNATCAV
jgi:hypothetical protein